MTNIQEIIDRPTLAKIRFTEKINRALPVILVAGIITSETMGLQFVFFPVYFQDWWTLRLICTVPIYIGIFMLTWTWIKAIFTDPGIILNNCNLTSEQIQQVKDLSNAHKRKVTV